MPTKPRPAKPKSASDRMRARRARLRAQGLRPVQFWVPDTRNPRVRAQIRKEAALLAQHPDKDAVDDWLDRVLADSEWT